MQTEAGGKISFHNNPGSVDLAIFDGGSSRAYLNLTPLDLAEVIHHAEEALLVLIQDMEATNA